MTTTEIASAVIVLVAFLLFLWTRIEKAAVQRRGKRELKIYKNPLTTTNQLRWALCPCGSGKKSKDCHGKERKLSLNEYNEIMKIGKKWAKKAKAQGVQSSAQQRETSNSKGRF